MPSVPGWQEAGKSNLAGRSVYQATEPAEAAELKSNTHSICATSIIIHRHHHNHNYHLEQFACIYSAVQLGM